MRFGTRYPSSGRIRIVEVRTRAAIRLATVVLLCGCSAESGDEPIERDSARPATTVTTSTLPWSDLAADGRAQGVTDQVPRSVRSICSAIATRAAERGSPQPVFCPPLVPDTRRIKVELAGGIMRYRQFDDGYNIGFWSADVRDATDFGGHWTVAAGAAKSLRVYTHPHPRLAPAGQEPQEPIVPQSARSTLRDVPATVYRIAPESRGFYAGHIVFEWRQGNTTFHFTMHGHEHEPQARVMAAALIEQVKACATERARSERPGTCDLVFGRG